MKKRVIHILFCLVLSTSAFGQFDSDPCNLKDTLARFVLQAHDYNKPGWYNNRDNIYLEIRHERDIHYDDDSAIAEFPDIGLMVYTEFIQGNIFDGLALVRKTDNGWTEIYIPIRTNIGISYEINRPDSLHYPYIIEIIYSEGFYATRGGDKGKVHEVWDVLNHIRLARFYSEHSHYYSSTSVDGSYSEGKSFSMERTRSFDGTTLMISETKGTEISYYQSHVEGEDQSEKTSENTIYCGPQQYNLINGFFVKGPP